MKIVAISDMHGQLPKVNEMPEGDVLCISGDTFPLEYQRDPVKSTSWFCLDFLPWTNALPYEKVIMIGGNHDFVFEPYGDPLKELLHGINKGKSKIVYLLDRSYDYKGIRFYGTPWISDLSRWAFYRPEENTLDKGRGLKELYSNIPKRCDVILTHQPPRIGEAGMVHQNNAFNNGSDYGSQVLADVIRTRSFQYLLCGHVHTGNHDPFDIGDGRKIVNVSYIDEDYRRGRYKPFVFEIEPFAGNAK